MGQDTGNAKIIAKLSESIRVTSHIEQDLFVKYNVKRGLRNADHSGVLVGLTKIGNVIGYNKLEDGSLEPTEGKLFYRGINVKNLVDGFQKEGIHGFDETSFLLLSGKLPTKDEIDRFSKYLAEERHLPSFFTKNMILPLYGKNIMNMLSRSVMVLYNYDENADNTDRENVMMQSVNLLAKFPVIIAYAYQSMRHSYYNEPLEIRLPKDELTTAENFLYMLKGEGNYTKLDADILDLALVLHAEHGGGNNSSFTVRVTSSSGTDTYSSITSGIGSLKGPLHGGANIKVMEMMENIKENVKNWSDEREIADYLLKILRKETFNKSGKLYGIGHAIYTNSDPRAVILKEKARELAKEKDRLEEFELYATVERLASQVFAEFKGSAVNKIVCANVDFYSGFVYDCIGIDKEVFTPLFAMSRVAGWCAHRIEELNFASKRIIRPAYKNVLEEGQYIPFADRDPLNCPGCND